MRTVKRRVVIDRFTSGLPGGAAPDGWVFSELGSLARVNPEQLGSKTDPDYLMEYLDIAAIEQPGFIGGGRTLRFAEAPSRARRVVRNGDILVSTVRPYLRNFAHVREAKGNLIASTGYAVVRPGEGVDGGYLYQKIMSPEFVEYLKTRMAGSNYPAVTAHDVGSYRLSLPPRSEQRKIAAILSSVDNTIEKTKAIVDQVQVAKRGVMNNLFTRGLPGWHIRFKNTKIGEIPADWMAMNLSDIATVVGGGTPRRSQQAFWNGDVPWATPTDVTGLHGRTIGETAASITGAGLTSSSATLLPPNSLLMTTRATIGACAINRVPMATNQGFQNLIPCGKLTCVDFLYYLIQYHARRLKQLAAGSTFLEISRRIVRGFRVYLPPLSEQRKIAGILSSMDDEIETSLRSLHTLQIVKTGLTSVLLTGELRVTPDTAFTDAMDIVNLEAPGRDRVSHRASG